MRVNFQVFLEHAHGHFFTTKQAFLCIIAYQLEGRRKLFPNLFGHLLRHWHCYLNISGHPPQNHRWALNPASLRVVHGYNVGDQVKKTYYTYNSVRLAFLPNFHRLLAFHNDHEINGVQVKISSDRNRVSKYHNTSALESVLGKLISFFGTDF